MDTQARTGTAHWPLDGGQAPRYLFDRMVKLGREISLVIISEYGTLEFMRFPFCGLLSNAPNSATAKSWMQSND